MMKKGTLALSLLALAFSAGSAAAATDYEWVGGDSGMNGPRDWQNPNNWSPNSGYPGSAAGDTARIPVRSDQPRVFGSPANPLAKIIIEDTIIPGVDAVSITIDPSQTLTTAEVELEATTQLTIDGSGTFNGTKVAAVGTGTEFIASVSNLIVGELEVMAAAEMTLSSTISAGKVDVQGTSALLTIDNQSLTLTASDALAIASGSAVSVQGTNGKLKLNSAGTNPIDGELHLASSTAELQINDDNRFEGAGFLIGSDDAAMVTIANSKQLRFDGSFTAQGAMTFNGGANAKLTLRDTSKVHAFEGEIILGSSLVLDDAWMVDNDEDPKDPIPTPEDLPRWVADTGTIHFQNEAELLGAFEAVSSGAGFSFVNVVVVTEGELYGPGGLVDNCTSAASILSFTGSAEFTWARATCP